MKFASKLFFTALLAVLFVGMAQAQAQQQQGSFRQVDPAQVANNQTERMKQDLSLTEEQTTKVKAINLKYAQKMTDARTEHRGNPEATRSAMQTLQTEKQAELATVLTKEQTEQWKAIQAERQQKWDEKSKERREKMKEKMKEKRKAKAEEID